MSDLGSASVPIAYTPMNATHLHHTDTNTLASNDFRPEAAGALRLETVASECLAFARGRNWSSCAALARRWLESDPFNADAALYLLNALKAPATADAFEAALDEYALLERRLEREHHKPPAREVAQLAASIRDTLAETRKHGIPVDANVPSRQGIDRGPPERTCGRVSTSRVASIPLAAVLFLGATSFTERDAASRPANGPGADRPSVAVIDVRNTAGDSATAWLELGLPQMVTSDIARLPGIDVVSPERVREARQALGLPRGATLTRDELRRLGEQSGARWVVTGGILRGDSAYVLDVTVEKTVGNGTPCPFTVTSPSLIALADQAAARLAGVVTADGGGPPISIGRR